MKMCGNSEELSAGGENLDARGQKAGDHYYTGRKHLEIVKYAVAWEEARKHGWIK